MRIIISYTLASRSQPTGTRQRGAEADLEEGLGRSACQSARQWAFGYVTILTHISRAIRLSVSLAPPPRLGCAGAKGVREHPSPPLAPYSSRAPPGSDLLVDTGLSPPQAG